MIRRAEIIAQYNELNEIYNRMSVDDNEAFIRSRVIEYFFNLTHDAVDELVLLINTTLDGEESDSQAVSQQKNTAADNEKITMPQPVRNTGSVRGRKESGRVLPVLGSIAVLAALAIFTFHRKK